MKRKQLKFFAGPAIIVLTLAWIGYSAFDANKAYYQTVSELYAMAAQDGLEGKRLKVAGDVVPGSIVENEDSVDFVISQEDQTLAVRYVGKGAIPDTFRDRAEAVVDGEYAGDGVFIATAMQAKCASKYESEMEAGVVPAISDASVGTEN